MFRHLITLIAVRCAGITENNGIRKTSAYLLGNKRLQGGKRDYLRVSTFAKRRDTSAPRIGTPARRNTATVINQRVNYGSVDESIPALARTRNIHADGFPSRGGKLRGRQRGSG